MKHYQTCTNPKELTKLNLDATSYILQCNCCGAYVEIPTPPDPAPITIDFSHLERRTAEVIETTTLSGGSVRTYVLK